MNHPPIEPRRFREAFEWILAIHNQAATIDAQLLEQARDIVSSRSGNRASSLQVVTVAVARASFQTRASFTVFLARVEALNAALADPVQQAAWRGTGWVRRSPVDADLIAPVRFLVEAASMCPLAVGAEQFDIAKLERVVQQLAHDA